MRLTKKDQEVLAECYSQVYNEGIFDSNQAAPDQPKGYGEPTKSFGGLEKYVPQEYGNLLPYKVVFSSRDDTQIVEVAPILERSPDMRQLATLNIVTSKGFITVPTGGQPQFDKLTLDNFAKSKTALAEIQKIVPGFGKSGEEGKIVGPNNTIERNAQAYGY